MRFSNFINFCKNLNFGHLLFVGALMSILIPFCNNSLGEVDNMFVDLDKSQTRNMLVVDSANWDLFLAIEAQTDVYKNVRNMTYLADVTKARKYSADFCKKIDSFRSELTVLSGGLDAFQRPVLYKDKKIAYAYFSQNQRVEWLNQQIINTRDSMLTCVRDPKDREKIERSMPIDTSIFYDNFLKEKFRNHSLSSVLSILNLMKSHAKTSETACLNYFAQEVVGNTICCMCDMMLVCVAPHQGSFIVGEKTKTDVVLTNFSPHPGSMRISVNGKAINIKDGVGHFSQKETELGRKKMSVNAAVFTKNKIGRNRYVSDTSYTHRDFYYEVVSPMAFLHTKTNRNLYLGVSHQIEIHIAEESDENIILSSKDLIVNKIENGKYSIQANKTGKVALRVDGKAFGQVFYFNVKKIPMPTARLDQQTNEIAMKNDVWRQQKSLVAEVKDFDFETDCQVESFVFTYIPQREDAIIIQNASANFNAQIVDIQKITKLKDVIHFTEIKAKCKGDTEARLLNTMVFEIK